MLKKSKKILTLKLPVTLEVAKLVYGIMIGVQINNKEVMYYDRFQLYEKEVTHIRLEGEHLAVYYPKRKDKQMVVLDRYVVRLPETVVQLFGRGDSIVVHDDDFI